MNRLLAILLLALSLAQAGLARGQVTANDIDDLRATISTRTALSEDARTTLLGRLDAAQTQLEVAEEFRALASKIRAETEQAPDTAAAFEQRLRDAQSKEIDHAAAIGDSVGAEQLISQVTLATAERQSMSERRSQLLAAVESLPKRREQVKERLVELQEIIDGPPESELPPDSSLDQKVAWLQGMIRKQAAAQEKGSLEAELLGESALSTVSAAERAWLGYAIGDADARIAALEAALKQARASATQEQLQTTSELQEKLQTEDPRLQEFAEENRRLARQLQDVSRQIDQARRSGQATQAILEGIEQDSRLMQRRLQVAGRKEVLGRVMITRMDSLPDTPSIRREIGRRNEMIATTSMAQIDTEEEFRQLGQSSDFARELVPTLDELNETSQELVRELVDQRSQLLEDNLKSLGSLLRILLDNNDRSTALIVATEDFHRFLLGNLLWVRNFSFLDPGTFIDQMREVMNPENWLRLPSQFASGYRALPWSGVLLGVVVLVFIMARRLRPIYEELLQRPVLLSEGTLWNILGGLLLTALLALPWPLVLVIMGYCLEAAARESDFSAALAPALMFTARVLYLLLFTRRIASRMGVGRRFLKWDSRMLDSLRKELNWAGPVFCLAVLVNIFAYNLDIVSSGGPLGAISLSVAAVSIIALCLRLLRQTVFKEARLVKLSLQACLAISAGVLVLQAMGLMFAAEIYMWALARSIAVLLAIKTVGDSLERWLLILRARMERKARDLQKSQDDDEEENGADEQASELDMLSLSEAHTKLLGMVRIIATIVAIWLIWSPSLPAFSLLESVELWHATDSADPSKVRAVTLLDLFYSVFVLIVTFLLTRHLPPVSEVFMREWFNMSPGARYASSILMQYVVIAIGVSICLNAIGWEWGKVQWLVAALGVGIGFGLQEIVANFISGIIILFERPVRVGDIISAGGAEGVVKEINPRATILETFDRKEHLIPNKELITGQVINWTLSDGAIRVIIPVGIAYGSDVRRALALLREAASEVTNVMDEPEPRASFEDFGDNALLLWLRCYVTDDRIGTWTELRTLINDKFTDAGIVIAFPQRDVHLDTLEPLQVEVRHLGDPSST